MAKSFKNKEIQNSEVSIQVSSDFFFSGMASLNSMDFLAFVFSAIASAPLFVFRPAWKQHRPAGNRDRPAGNQDRPAWNQNHTDGNRERPACIRNFVLESREQFF